ncbi:UNVERIFIED_CONTAM: hypothetical protein FKN15_001417 [Acipenser sinensis]
MPPKQASKKKRAALIQQCLRSDSVKEGSLAGPSCSYAMLEDFRQIVKEVIRDEIVSLTSEIQMAIALIQATLLKRALLELKRPAPCCPLKTSSSVLILMI